MKFLKNHRGDTILEVLISIAVLSFILGASLALANRSGQAVRQAAERSETQKIADSQIEQLKAYIGSGNPDIKLPTPTNKNFCLSKGTYYQLSNDIPADPQQDNFDHYGTGAPPDDQKCKSGEFYYSFVEAVEFDSNNRPTTFLTHTRWYGVTGHGVDEATKIYRIYPDLAALGADTGTVTASCTITEFRNSIGVCTPCQPTFPPNYFGGEVSECSPKPPELTVVVKKVKPNSNNTTPSCISNNLENRAGSLVRLNGGSQSLSQTTGNDSSTTFQNLEFGQKYEAEFSAPGGNNPDGNPSFTACQPQTEEVVTGNPPEAAGSTHTIDNFKFIPNCYVTFGPVYPHNVYWHDHGYDYPVYGEYWVHTGWGDGRRKGWPTYTFYTWENGNLIEYRFRGDLGYNNNTGWFYERWERFVYVKYYVHVYIWHLHQEDWRADPSNVCPS